MRGAAALFLIPQAPELFATHLRLRLRLRRILANMPQRACKLSRQKAASLSVVDSWCVAHAPLCSPPRAAFDAARAFAVRAASETLLRARAASEASPRARVPLVACS